jgi:UDP-glucose-4-epimerase GalE
LIVGDLRDEAALDNLFRTAKISAVIHFAAHAYVGESVVDPDKYYDNNVNGTLCLLRAMRKADCSKIVFSSTCAVYGQPTTVPISEDERKQPINPYGYSKLVVERMLADFNRAYGLKYIVLRYFNACGGDPEGELGELRYPETHLIPRALMSILGHVRDFEVFGNDFPTPDGTAIRDYIHVADLAAGHIKALEALEAGQGSGYYNLGTGKGVSVQEILAAIAQVTGVSMMAPQGARREGDPAVLIANASRAKLDLAWRPTLSDLETIIRTSWKWHQVAHPAKATA